MCVLSGFRGSGPVWVPRWVLLPNSRTPAQFREVEDHLPYLPALAGSWYSSACLVHSCIPTGLTPSRYLENA